jgi:hypothetical protein
MATIKVTKKFLLNMADGVKHTFDVGLHSVESAIASHWYTKLHAEVLPEQPSPEVQAETKLEARPSKKSNK